MAAVLTVPYTGSSVEKDRKSKGTETVDMPVAVRRATWTRNDHNHADELELSLEWRDSGVDPRFLKNATVQFWMGEAKIGEDFEPTDKNLRFTGICTRVRRMAREDSGYTVDMSFLDYTTLFLKTKPFPTEGVPSYSDTLVDAWKKICDHVGWADGKDPTKIHSSVAALRDRLVFRLPPDIDGPSLVIGKCTSDRFRQFCKVPIKPKADAWEVWEYIVGMLGLISWIDRDQVIVSNTVELYAKENAPRLIWGENVAAADESMDTNFSNKGVCINSYDPLRHKLIEVFWPVFFDARIQSKNVVAVKKGYTADELQSEQYDYFDCPYPGVTDEATLLQIAIGAYEERSRQEIEGSIRTHEMKLGSVDGSEVDILDLHTGDCIRVEIAENSKALLSSMGSFYKRYEYLQDLGYSEGVARLIAKNMDPYGQLESTFHVKRLHVQLEDGGDSGEFAVDITYHNRIKVTGDTDDK